MAKHGGDGSSQLCVLKVILFDFGLQVTQVILYQLHGDWSKAFHDFSYLRGSFTAPLKPKKGPPFIHKSHLQCLLIQYERSYQNYAN
jgi:hypothetical protein